MGMVSSAAESAWDEYTGRLPVDMGLGGHRNLQSWSVSTLSTHPFESVVGMLEVSYWLFGDSAA